jgi:hypothetical protein
MKRPHVILYLFLAGVSLPSFNQTIDIEKDNLMEKYLAGELTQLQFKDASFLFRDLLDSVGYPSAPYDSASNRVEYTYFHSLEGIGRETIVNRVFEWAAVTFGNTNGLLTQQGNASRLIINGSIEIPFPDMFMVWKNDWKGYVETELQNSGICYFTLVFTIQEGRMKSQVINISYEYTDFVNNQTVTRPLKSCFPVTNHQKKEWKSIMTQVKETESGLGTMMDHLVTYINDYEDDYDW